MQLTPIDIIAAEKELCRRSLAYFIKRAWRHVVPDKLQWNWHIEAIAQHLEAVHRGEITRLLINIPPGTSKSTIVGVMYPAWIWGPGGQPWHRYIGAAHEQGLAVRDNRIMRNLITSEWYQSLWPITMSGDQNEKLYFENDKQGFRQACAVASMTGRRGHTIVWDDPLSPEKAMSDLHRETSIRILSETVPTRLNDPDKSAIIVIMQRLHEGDPSGHILTKDLGYDHLCVPMEFETDRRSHTSIGWTDPRTIEGELLDAVRFPASVIDRDKKAMGPYAWAGQMQQRPAPRGGGMFKRSDFRVIQSEPAGYRWVRGWDLAATDDPSAARTAGVKMGIGPDNRLCIAHVVKDRVNAAGVERLLGSTVAADGQDVRGSIPQDPGSAGKSWALHLLKHALMGYSYTASPETGDKETRAMPLAAQVEAGNVDIVAGDWNGDFLDEASTFPMGKFKDQIDAATRAFDMIVAPRASAGIFLRKKNR